MALNVTDCAAELKSRFLEKPVETLPQWLDWKLDAPLQEVLEARRLVEEVRLRSWVQTQKNTQVFPFHPS